MKFRLCLYTKVSFPPSWLAHWRSGQSVPSIHGNLGSNPASSSVSWCATEYHSLKNELHPKKLWDLLYHQKTKKATTHAWYGRRLRFKYRELTWPCCTECVETFFLRKSQCLFSNCTVRRQLHFCDFYRKLCKIQ